jgi:hypothetical protein
MGIKAVRPNALQECVHDLNLPIGACRRPTLMAREERLDVRGLEAPEPLVRIVAALDHLGPEDRLTIVIDCRPIPLYKILEHNGFGYREAPGAESLLEITVWKKT